MKPKSDFLFALFHVCFVVGGSGSGIARKSFRGGRGNMQSKSNHIMICTIALDGCRTEAEAVMVFRIE